MFSIYVVLALWVAVASASTDSWTGLSVTYGSASTASVNKNNVSMFDVPLYIGQEVASGEWVPTIVPNYYNLQALAYKVPYDYAVTPLYDSNGFIAGVSACHNYAAHLATSPTTYDAVAQGTMEVFTIDGVEQICSSFLVVSPETIIAGGRTSADTLGDGLWLRNTADTITGYTKVPDSVTELLETTTFEWENCVAVMDVHYFANSTTDFDCDRLYNWFLLGDKATDTVNGIGILLYGNHVDYNTGFFETLSRAAVETIVPIVNECFYEYIETYNAISIHMFFTNDAEDRTCTTGDGAGDSS